MQPLQSPIRSIQALRAIAALLVLVFHLDVQLHRLGYVGEWAIWPQRGVDIFFIISGVVMYLSTNKAPVDIKRFYLQRLIRIIPLYYLLTLFLIVILWAAPNLSVNSGVDWFHVVTSFLFIPSLHPYLHLPYPILIPGWTLNCEMLFYLVFGGTLLLPQSRRVMSVSVVMVFIVLAASLAPKHSAVSVLYGWSIFFEFSIGLALGASICANRYLSVPQAWFWLSIGVISLTNPFAESFRVIVGGLPALAIVASVISLENADVIKIPKFAIAVGNASYALYLSQQLTLAALTQAFLKFGLLNSSSAILLYILFALVFSISIAIVVYRWIENPMHRKLKSWGDHVLSYRSNLRSQNSSEEGNFHVGPRVV